MDAKSQSAGSEASPAVEVVGCPGPGCALTLLRWLRSNNGAEPASARQASLWSSVAYSDEAAAIRHPDELAAAFEHLEYAVFRRFHNELTRAERTRLDNTTRNVLYKIERYALSLAEGPERSRVEAQAEEIRDRIRDRRDELERQRRRARRAELKLAQLATLSPQGFEEYVAELLESLGWNVRRTGGSNDQGVDLMADREGLKAIVQCKYHGKAVVGSPELQALLGAVARTGSHKGLLVTTGTFTLAAERFAINQPLELIDGPRLSELVRDALGGDRGGDESTWFDS